MWGLYGKILDSTAITTNSTTPLSFKNESGFRSGYFFLIETKKVKAAVGSVSSVVNVLTPFPLTMLSANAQAGLSSEFEFFCISWPRQPKV